MHSSIYPPTIALSQMVACLFSAVSVELFFHWGHTSNSSVYALFSFSRKSYISRFKFNTSETQLQIVQNFCLLWLKYTFVSTLVSGNPHSQVAKCSNQSYSVTARHWQVCMIFSHSEQVSQVTPCLQGQRVKVTRAETHNTLMPQKVWNQFLRWISTGSSTYHQK